MSKYFSTETSKKNILGKFWGPDKHKLLGEKCLKMTIYGTQLLYCRGQNLIKNLPILTLFHAGFLRVLSHAGGGSCEPPPGISAVAP